MENTGGKFTFQSCLNVNSTALTLKQGLSTANELSTRAIQLYHVLYGPFLKRVLATPVNTGAPAENRRQLGAFVAPRRVPSYSTGGGRVSHLLRFNPVRNRISSFATYCFSKYLEPKTFPVIRRRRSCTTGKSPDPFKCRWGLGGLGWNEAYRDSVPRPSRSDSSLPNSNVIAISPEEGPT
ncbi:hypothetical protein CEXT_85071 [Caerostris extrusa]|uniref:Uncharacterized protein n=1 Tax=Caerostris extrusa TaxID=172846 RepID=A0AAV4UDZ9_CAEEX|nr:hypothetical protein CEXT_85071 [Caerostris extrusa]